MTSLAAITLGGATEPWSRLGFDVDVDGNIAFANGALCFEPDAPSGLTGLVVPGIDGSIEGIPVVSGVVVSSDGPHRNGAFELDHVVVMTDSLERTSAVITEVLGLECRRVREVGPVRQGFHRFADIDGARGCIIEVVERVGSDTPSLWGIVVNVVDIDAATGFDHVAAPKPAVQPGRFIAGVDKAAEHGVPLAFMSS